MIDAQDSHADKVAGLDSQTLSLEERLAHLEAEQRKLRQELERLYAELMSEFEKRWPPLKRMPDE